MDKMKVLERLKAELDDLEVESQIIDDRDFSPEPVLISENPGIGAYGHDAISQYFFADYDIAAEGTDYFNSVVVLDSDIPDDYLDNVFRAASYLNYYIPCGSFVLDENNQILFKFGVPVNSNMSDDDAFQYLNKLAAHALVCFRKYISILVDVAEGKLEPMEVIELFGGDVDEEE